MVLFAHSQVRQYEKSPDFLNSGCKFHEMLSREECLQKGRQAIKQASKSIKQHRGIFLLLIVVNLVWSFRLNPEIQVKCQGYQTACLEGKQKQRQRNYKERMLSEKRRYTERERTYCSTH
jgi:hypothetical protein